MADFTEACGSFSALASTTEASLRSLWDEVGLGEAERTRQLQNLVAEVRGVFERAVAEEEGIRAEYLGEVGRLREDIRAVAERTDQEFCEVPDSEAGTIMGELTWLRAHHEELDAVCAVRLEAINAVLCSVQRALSDLGTPVAPDLAEVGPKVTEERAAELRSKLAELEAEREHRTAAIRSTVCDVVELFEELEVKPIAELDAQIAAGGTELGVTMAAVEAVSRRASELMEEKKARKERLTDLGEKIKPLWAKLDVDEDARRAFFDENKGLGMRVVERCEEELRRLLALKAERLGELVGNCRARVAELWERSELDGAARAAFAPQLESDEFTDALLEAHEAEVGMLEARAEAYFDVLKDAKRHNRIFGERGEYNAKLLDSSRLLSRKPGSKRREEEEQRKRVLSLPTLTKRLRVALVEFEAAHGPFLFEGARFLPAMEAVHAEYAAAAKEEKDRKAAARKGRSTSSSSSRSVGRRTPAKAGVRPPRAPLSPSNRNGNGAPRSAVKSAQRRQAPGASAQMR